MADIDHLLLILTITVLTDTLIHRFHGYARFTWNFLSMTLFTWVMLFALYTLTGIWITYGVFAVFNIFTADASLRRDSSCYENYLGTIYRKLD